MNETYNFSLTDTEKLNKFYEEIINERLLEAKNLNDTIPGDILDAYKKINESASSNKSNIGNEISDLNNLKTKIGKLKQKDLYDLARELNVPKRSTLKKPLLLAAVSKAIDDKISELSTKDNIDTQNLSNGFEGIPSFLKSSIQTLKSQLAVSNEENKMWYDLLISDFEDISEILYYGNELNKNIFSIPLLISRVERDMDDIDKKIEAKKKLLDEEEDLYEQMKLTAAISGLKASRNSCEVNLASLNDKYNNAIDIKNSLNSPKEYRDELVYKFSFIKSLVLKLKNDGIKINIENIDKSIDKSINLINDSFATAVNKENKVDSILDKIGYSRFDKEPEEKTKTKAPEESAPVNKPVEPEKGKRVENPSNVLDKLKTIGDGVLYDSMDPKPLSAKEIKLTYEDGSVHDVIAFDMFKNTHYNKYIFDYVDLSNNKVSSAMLSYNDKEEACAVFINHNFIHNVSKLTEPVSEETKSTMINKLNDMYMYKKDPNKIVKDDNTNDKGNGLQGSLEPVTAEVEPDFSSVLIPPTEDQGAKEEEVEDVTNDEQVVQDITEGESPFVNDSAATIYGGKKDDETLPIIEEQPALAKEAPVVEENKEDKQPTSQFSPKKTLEEAKKTKGYIQPTFRGTMVGEESGMPIPQPVYNSEDQQEFLEEMGYMKPLMSKEDIKISNEPAVENKTSQELTKLNTRVKKAVEKQEKSPIEFLKDKARALKAAISRRNAVSYGTMVTNNLEVNSEGKGQR